MHNCTSTPARRASEGAALARAAGWYAVPRDTDGVRCGVWPLTSPALTGWPRLRYKPHPRVASRIALTSTKDAWMPSPPAACPSCRALRPCAALAGFLILAAAGLRLVHLAVYCRRRVAPAAPPYQ